ncbi:MAG: hypothetical protein ACK578_22110 [Pirellula sp.]|jgi:hypothetical protein
MNKSLRRKTIYIVAIIGLLLPLYGLGRPVKGTISRLRDRHSLGQSNLGQLDPTSESMKLATLGMRGIASSILWIKADYYKEEKYFDRFSATLNQIALLQPHFISVWQHQAHNMSFNVSPEFEDYRLRYEWVKKGIDYLVRGTKYNDKKPILEYDLGHYVGNKLGKFDEKKQYRELFRKDTDFHNYFTENGLAVETNALGYDQRPDNWRVGKLWFNKAVASYQSGNKIAKTPHLLYCYSPLWQMYYGEAIQTEGILDDRSKFAWEQGGREWADYGRMSIPWSGDGQIKLLETVQEMEKIRELKSVFDEKTEGIAQKISDRRFERLDDATKLLLKKPEEEQTPDDREKIFATNQSLKPSYQQVVAECPKEVQASLLQIVTELSQREERLRITEIYRSNVNYGYWADRATAEQKNYTVDARRLLFEADKMIDLGDVKGALENYDKAWALWDEAFRRYPILIEEEVGDSVFKAIRRYNRLTEEENTPDFVLHWFVEYRRLKATEGLQYEADRMLDELKAKAATLEDDKALPSTSELDRYFKLTAPVVPEVPKGDQPPPDPKSSRVPMEVMSRPEVVPEPSSNSSQPSPASTGRPPSLENPSDSK